MSIYELIGLVNALVIVAWICWPSGRKKSEQLLFVFCPDCRVDLCAQADAFQSDDERGICYICQCGRESWWNFDIIPGAIQMTGPSGKIMEQ